MNTQKHEWNTKKVFTQKNSNNNNKNATRKEHWKCQKGRQICSKRVWIILNVTNNIVNFTKETFNTMQTERHRWWLWLLRVKEELCSPCVYILVGNSCNNGNSSRNHALAVYSWVWMVKNFSELKFGTCETVLSWCLSSLWGWVWPVKNFSKLKFGTSEKIIRWCLTSQ